ncbi:hypothetical protein PTSG_11292 [Salpingoeca rosetta]|uniref:PCI domain-containing protein n=1 Tax=Salpingoeca rosetta (strain ATCC 50818 / BSB-021) TaxID=946362 RepID=F2USZ8_SALR5|nr:uncharacterized protein PTSG_11292 [Salpingoeca rosetta]EGD81257.1 hypothetical protein PTSG_11292 [Salpingoeca rosetta]|eukprot:XP_004987653.1 hypothetical protein PTSG_11292 [Salpingoeca rosetta]
MAEKAQAVYEKLREAWRARKLDECQSLLTQMKIALTEISLFPSEDEEVKVKELVLARDSLEIGAFWAIEKEDAATFERYMKQLKVYYFDFASKMPESSFMYELLGLDLMHLLSQNRIADFHTALERLDTTLIQENTYIRHPVELEQYLMEGSYNKVHLAQESAPSQSYNLFLHKLMGTIRHEIASCCESAYDSLKLEELKSLLYTPSDAEIDTIIKAHPDWDVQGDTVHFPHMHETTTGLQTNTIIDRTLTYAKELETIV